MTDQYRTQLSASLREFQAAQSTLAAARSRLMTAGKYYTLSKLEQRQHVAAMERLDAAIAQVRRITITQKIRLK